MVLGLNPVLSVSLPKRMVYLYTYTGRCVCVCVALLVKTPGLFVLCPTQNIVIHILRGLHQGERVYPGGMSNLLRDLEESSTFGGHTCPKRCSRKRRTKNIDTKGSYPNHWKNPKGGSHFAFMSS